MLIMSSSYDEVLSDYRGWDKQVTYETQWAQPMSSDFQKPFHSSSTPNHLDRYYMVWNSVGMIRCYNTDGERTVEIDFHDTSVRRSIFMDNVLGNTMAALSDTAAVLACESQHNSASKLTCVNFTAFDDRKEWTVDMPLGESIKAVAVGETWTAICTDHRLIRIFSVGGFQRESFLLPGPLISAVGHSKYLALAYHRGAGLPGSQCPSALLVTVNPSSIDTDKVELPLQDGATLSWIGFSDESSLCVYDSSGYVYLSRRSRGVIWIPVINPAAHGKTESDNYFIIGVSEARQCITCVLCKGSKYPSTSPKPNPILLPFNLSFCEPHTDKCKLEEDYWKTVLRLSSVKAGTAPEKDATKDLRKNLVKLFKLAYRNGNMYRACELYNTMDLETAKSTMSYVSRMKNWPLLEKLQKLDITKALNSKT